MKRILLTCAIILLSACTQPDTAKRVLEDAGYTNVQLHGYSFLGCSKEDFYHESFTAKSPNGRVVSGTVCSGFLFKNTTIRFE